MARYIPKNKLGKKARRELDRQQRRVWQPCPVTKMVESKKVYKRKKNSRDFQED